MREGAGGKATGGALNDDPRVRTPPLPPTGTTSQSHVRKCAARGAMPRKRCSFCGFNFFRPFDRDRHFPSLHHFSGPSARRSLAPVSTWLASHLKCFVPWRLHRASRTHSCHFFVVFFFYLGCCRRRRPILSPLHSTRSPPPKHGFFFFLN